MKDTRGPFKRSDDDSLLRAGPGQGILVNSYDDGSKETKNNEMLTALKKRQQKSIQDLAQNPGAADHALNKAMNVQMGKATRSLRPKEESNM